MNGMDGSICRKEGVKLLYKKLLTPCCYGSYIHSHQPDNNGRNTYKNE